MPRSIRTGQPPNPGPVSFTWPTGDGSRMDWQGYRDGAVTSRTCAFGGRSALSWRPSSTCQRIGRRSRLVLAAPWVHSFTGRSFCLISLHLGYCRIPDQGGHQRARAIVNFIGRVRKLFDRAARLPVLSVLQVTVWRPCSSLFLPFAVLLVTSLSRRLHRSVDP
jgi:hypothetical protein